METVDKAKQEIIEKASKLKEADTRYDIYSIINEVCAKYNTNPNSVAYSLGIA